MKVAVSNRLEEVRKHAPLTRLTSCYNDHAQWEFVIALVSKLDSDFVYSNGKEKALEYMAKRVHDNWGVGDSQCQTGVVLFLSRDDRFMHFSTGAGAKSVLTNTLLNEVIDRMKDKLRSGDNAGALLGAIDDVERIIEEGYVTNPFLELFVLGCCYPCSRIFWIPLLLEAA